MNEVKQTSAELNTYCHVCSTTKGPWRIEVTCKCIVGFLRYDHILEKQNYRFICNDCYKKSINKDHYKNDLMEASNNECGINCSNNLLLLIKRHNTMNNRNSLIENILLYEDEKKTKTK